MLAADSSVQAVPLGAVPSPPSTVDGHAHGHLVVQSSQPLIQPDPPPPQNNFKPTGLHPSSSRLTRFLSKFTNNNLNSKRKASLPNLSVLSHTSSNPSSATPANTSSNPARNPSSSSSASTFPRQTHRPLSSLPPINTTPSDHSETQRPQALPHLSDSSAIFNSSIKASSSEPDLPLVAEENGLELELDGADPNASIRPLTPSSKAASPGSPVHLISRTTTPISPRVRRPSLSPRDSFSLELQSKPTASLSCSSSSFSSSGGLPDDSISNFGNASLASTKPTTVISVEQPNPMIGNNRIAQNHLINRLVHPPHHHHPHHHRSSSPSLAPLQPSTPLSMFASPPLSPGQPHSQPTYGLGSLIKAPKHSLPHPSQNPHPAALADNASMLTLASSGFAPSLHAVQNLPPDEDASVRGLAPSRRESTESLSSRYSQMRLNRGSSLRTTGTTSARGLFIGIGLDDEGDGDGRREDADVVYPPNLSPLGSRGPRGEEGAVATAGKCNDDYADYLDSVQEPEKEESESTDTDKIPFDGSETHKIVEFPGGPAQDSRGLKGKGKAIDFETPS